MEKRTVKIKVTTKADLIEKESAATTYKELKKDFAEIENWEDMKAVVRETRQTLELDDAFLPQGAFTLFLYVKKIKGGTPYSEWLFSELRKACAERDDISGDKGNYGSYEAMIKKLEESDEIQATSRDSVKTLIVEELALLSLDLENIIEMIKNLPEDTDKASIIEEYEKVKSRLNELDNPGILYK